MATEEMFILPQEKLDLIDNFIEENRQKTKYFHEEGESEILNIPVGDGELRVFHHKPKDQLTKRPIVFFPGFGNPPLVWQDFGLPIHNKGEYFVIETGIIEDEEDHGELGPHTHILRYIFAQKK